MDLIIKSSFFTKDDNRDKTIAGRESKQPKIISL